jgi:CheY-like chemotaxis protein
MDTLIKRGLAMGNKMALIVDDDPSTCQLVARYMTALDYQADIALSGAEALCKLRSGQRYNLVISDVRMPNGSGIDLLREMQIGIQHIPVILISAERAGAKNQAKAMGADAFLLKPFTREELADLVHGIESGNLPEIELDMMDA